MRVILSRKGFDETAGGKANPIMPDGTLLSLPIPSNSSRHYSELRYGDETYENIIKQLGGKYGAGTCHIDPDIRKGVYDVPAEWKPIFGQCDAALTHLKNQNVGQHDLFLFYGWFKQTERKEGRLRYILNAPNLHIVYGYLQVGKMVTDKEEITEYHWHPHAHMSIDNNCLFIARDTLSWNSNLDGYGVFSYDKRLVLTRDEAKNRSEWGELPELLKKYNLTMTKQRQEHVIQEHPAVEAWAKSLIG